MPVPASSYAQIVALGSATVIALVAAQSAYDIALGITAPPSTMAPTIVEYTYNPTVPLANCFMFGPTNNFMFEWQLNLAPQNTLQMRYTVDSTRGFTGMGFEYSGLFQILTGDPVASLPCGRALYDDYSTYDINGNVMPDYPEVPAALISDNGTVVQHYIMRNLSNTAASMLRSGGSITANLTLVWAFQLSSLFNGACYGTSVTPLTEMAQLKIQFDETTYSAAGGQCKTYTGPINRGFGYPSLFPTLLQGETEQCNRVAILFVGGDMLVRSGRRPPFFSQSTGYVLAGENKLGVCQASLSTVTAVWNGFSDSIGGITEYQVSLGTPAYPILYADSVDVGTTQSYTFSGLSLTPNSTLIVTVTAYNFAGLFTTVVSKPIEVLNGNLPVFGTIAAGTVSQTLFGPLQFQQSTTELSAYWTGWIAADHSSKNYNTGAFTNNGFQYAVGLKGGSVNGVLNWVTVPTWETSIQITGLTLVNGNTYTVTIRSINCAGTYTQETTAGVTVDTTPPIPGVVYFGNSTYKQQTVANPGTRVQATWNGFSDPIAGIQKYEWSMSTSQYAPLTGDTGLILPWIDVGLLTFGRNATIAQMPDQSALTIGTKIYIHVKATDNAGNFVIANSNATTIVSY